jgi:preprotein translocase subunit SecA
MQAFNFSEPKPIPEPPFAIWSKLQVAYLGRLNKRVLKSYWQEVEKINALSEQLEDTFIDPSQLEKSLNQARGLARRDLLVKHRESLYQALVMLRYISQTRLGLRPYDVQLVCALAMLDGFIVQLAPGEGKTLTISLVASIMGWSGQPCHVITANDYLAERDAKEMRPFFQAGHLDVDAITQQMAPADKHQAYQSAVVYSTAKQLLADFLHDKLLFGAMPSRARLSMQALKGEQTQFLMRGLFAVIVDEADSILIDDATTPLIISAPEPNPLLVEAVYKAKDLVDLMQPRKDYEFEKERSGIKFSRSGEELIKKHQPSFPRLWHSKARIEDLLYQAIMARDHFKLDQHYVLVEDKVVIVDESTGRMMPGRSWSYGLHQAVEARAGVELTDPSKTMEKMSFQNFFKLYHRLTGASGTLQNIHHEIFHNYKVRILEVPSRLVSKLSVKPYQAYVNQDKKIQALVERLMLYHQQGWPVLIGTRRIYDNEKLAQVLDEKGLPYELLNAKHLEREAAIVQQAGMPFKITLATNMAGRGTDIKVAADVLAQGGLRVLMLEPHESARVDWQLFGRAGRQGQPGQAIPYVSLDDELLKEHLPVWLKPLRYLCQMLAFTPNRLISLLVYLSQQNAHNKAFRKRRLVNKNVKDSKERLSFVRSTG